ncbi:MAG: PH domain-containing protein [Muribaculaceae bacterium]|nr:PH domain-containing protein [Muribaculaceae bacterium]MDE6553858.1 PH domain-containing protein [Muribaculaceae bacterium]
MKDVRPVEDLKYEQIEPRYRNVQLILTALTYILLAAAALFLLLIDDSIWCIIAECIIFAAMIVNLFIVNKAWESKGYALRENDITFKSGVVFPKTTTVPYDRLQQVSVTQNPVSKIFKLYAVDIVNGAQGLSSTTIPGLTEERANQIKDLVIQKLRNDD